MFKFWKEAKMISALKSCKKYNGEMGLGQELSDTQMNTIIQSNPFKDISSIYKSKGMTEWGGLAWFCGEFTSRIFDQLNQGETVKPHVKEIAEKLASISIAIAASVPGLKLTPEDMHAIGIAADIASQWIQNDPLVEDLKQSGLI